MNSCAYESRAACSISLARAGLAVTDVRADRAGEQHGLLRDDRECATQVGEPQLAHVDAFEHHAPRRDVVEAVEQRQDRRLAGARRADHRDDLAGLDRERDVVEHFLLMPRRIREADAVEMDRTFAGRQRLGVIAVANLGHGVDHGEQPIGRASRALERGPQRGEIADRAGDEERVQEERQ